MAPVTLSWYIAPVVAAVVFVLLTIPPVDEFFNEYIPNPYYNILTKALILMVAVFIAVALEKNARFTRGKADKV